MIVRFARDESEVDQCLSMACSIFKNTNTHEAYKDLLWKKAPGFNSCNVIVLEYNSEIIGCLRFQPLDLFFNGGYNNSVVLSSILIKENYRKLGFSNLLMKESLNLLKNNGFKFAYLVARRALDSYYNKFGFLGVSSYDSVSLKLPRFLNNKKYSVRPACVLDLIVCEESYKHSYKECNGHTRRNSDFWKYSFDRLAFIKSVNINIVEDSNIPIGYYIQDTNRILEIGFKSDEELVSLEFFGSFLSQFETLIIDLPFNHMLTRQMDHTLDMTSSSRRCLFGGHMLCDLDTVQDLELQDLEKRFMTEYRISILGGDKGDRSLNFNLPYLDQL